MPEPRAQDVRVLAHRGASARWPEHTRAAYVQALADGADGLECDVRLTADGMPVLWHDATVDRTSDGHGPVHGHTLAQLRALDLGVPGGPPDQLMTLEDLVALALAAERPVELAVELKHPVPAGLRTEDVVVRTLERAGWKAASGGVGRVRVTFMSFDPASLAHLAATASVLPRDLVALVEEVDAGAADGALAAADEARAMVDDGRVATAGPDVKLLRTRPAMVAGWLRAGARLRVWTVEDPVDVDLCVAAGAHEVTTDDPARVLSLLGRRATG